MAEDLLPPNATLPEKALSTSIKRLGEVPVPIETLWQADHCPLKLLPWLAWTLSVDEWDDTWHEAVKRQVIKSSVETHSIKGTRKSIRLVLDALGYESDIRAWYEQEPKGEPYHFEVIAWRRRNVPVIKDVIKRMNTLIDGVKSTRDHFQLSLTFNVDTGFYVSGIKQYGIHHREQTYKTAILPPAHLLQTLNTASVGYQVGTHSHDTLTSQLPRPILTLKPAFSAALRGYHINDLTMGSQLP